MIRNSNLCFQEQCFIYTNKQFDKIRSFQFLVFTRIPTTSLSGCYIKLDKIITILSLKKTVIDGSFFSCFDLTSTDKIIQFHF